MAIGIAEFLFAEVHIEGLSEWLWRGYEHGPDEFPASVKIDLEDGMKLDFKMYCDRTNGVAIPEQEVVRRACVVVTLPQPQLGDGRVFRRMAEKLSRFLSFVTDTHLQVVEIVGYAQDRTDSKLTKGLIPIALWKSAEIESVPTISYLIPIPRYRDVRRRFPNLVQQWFLMYDEWSYPLDLYFIGAVERATRYAEPDLVLAVMALEALHTARGGNDGNLNRKLMDLMEPFESHFGSGPKQGAIADRIRVLRNKCAHGGQWSNYGYEGRDLANSLCFTESLFKLHVLRRLKLDIDDIVGRGTQLALRLERAREVSRA